MNALTEQRKARLIQTAEGDVLPLEVMVSRMREFWNAGQKDEAVVIAEKCAPYFHPKLAAVEHSGNEDKPLAIEVVSGVTRIIDTLAHDSDSDGEPRPTH